MIVISEYELKQRHQVFLLVFLLDFFQTISSLASISFLSSISFIYGTACEECKENGIFELTSVRLWTL